MARTACRHAQPFRSDFRAAASPNCPARREAAQLARSLSELHGGLPALLAATAAEAPGAAAHTVPSAAATASALFVAANEFLATEAEGDVAAAAECLMHGGWAGWGGVPRLGGPLPGQLAAAVV